MEDEESDNYNSASSRHSRSSTNSKLVHHQQNSLAEGSSESSASRNMKEVSSDEEEKLTRRVSTHKLEIVKNKSTKDDEINNKKASNALLKALNRRKTENILNFNAASNKIPEPEPEIRHEVLGLSDDQIEYKERTNCLFRYNDNWRKNWDLFIMGLAIWN